MIPIRNKKKTLEMTVEEMRNFAFVYVEKYAPSKQQLKTYLLKKYLKSSGSKVNKSDITNLIDIVLSDMAVNTTGNKNLDSIQTSELCLDAMQFSKEVLKNDGKFISKIFVGSTFNEIIAESKKIFKKSKVFKPGASRKESKESFIICSMLR